MRSRNLLCWLSLAVTAVVAQEQEYIGNHHISRRNLTLKFDDLPTNDSGIGYNPQTNSTPLHYKDLYFQSFTVVNVAKARKSLPNPIDLHCAYSAPNALFSHRQAGYPWPRFSLHSLTDPSLPRDPRVTFNMRSIRISPTGRVPENSVVVVRLDLLKLPPDESLGKGKNSLPWPELIGAAPLQPEGRFYRLIAIFWPGPHQSAWVDWDVWRIRKPDLATKVDTFEVYGQLLERDVQNGPLHVAGDWEVCLDDVAIEVVRKSGHDEEEAEEDEVVEEPITQFVFVGENGNVVLDQERGERLMKELGSSRP